MADTLYKHYGGFAAVSRVVLDFYERVLDEDEVADFFDGVEMSRLIDHQTKFIASLLGGPASYSDDRLQQIHAHLDIDDDAFDRVSALLAGTLAKHGFRDEHVAQVIGEFERRRPLVVKRETRGAEPA